MTPETTESTVETKRVEFVDVPPLWMLEEMRAAEEREALFRGMFYGVLFCFLILVTYSLAYDRY